MNVKISLKDRGSDFAKDGDGAGNYAQQFIV